MREIAKKDATREAPGRTSGFVGQASGLDGGLIIPLLCFLQHRGCLLEAGFDGKRFFKEENHLVPLFLKDINQGFVVVINGVLGEI